ncbi:PQQ-dependent sugar dehydrogenase [Rhodoplanes sp. Z2-YC6860]|uniref:PQQ-dependent sugar dehydrogenase n=1 Tax=Rhodoplanes sp. Z2-YC6860 TaxID=674703 RepID=UPI00078C75F9|nr:PQQ-dependent sugar dehydrogenase [Rhodoplanes sp. Z2-YC6860]AMN40134.1 glucose sorbosone dehydrogenase [Rhodoplanes sp. Z2-YC6860]
MHKALAVIVISIALPSAVGPSIAEAQTFKSSAGNIAVETVAGGLVNPWALAFLPDGRMLVTERPGRMRIVTPDGKLSAPLGGVPKVFAVSQGGLLDVVLDRGFAGNKTIYFCFAEPSDGGGRTALARATLGEGKLDGVKVIYQQKGPVSSGNHFGCRIAQGSDNNLLLTQGEHFTDRNEAQKLTSDLGKIVRIAPDGSVPKDNPFVGRNDALPEIWSYGHRNAQGAAIHPQSGKLWEHEHGAKGGDEINIPQPGKNYGWPVISFGVNYDGTPVGSGKSSMPGMEQPIKYWVPSIAPSGMAFYTGDLFPSWKGSLFVGALAGQMLVRLTLDGEKVTGEERLLQGLRERIRDVRMGPDGALYLVTDNYAGRVLKVLPAK